MSTETTIAERFRHIREELNITQTELAKKIGIKQQIIADIERGRTQKIATPILEYLCKKHLINTEWLLFNFGNMTKIEDEDDAVEKYYNDNVVGICKYDIKLSNEQNKEKSDYDDKDILYFDRRWIKVVLGVNPDNLFFIRANDDSMNSGKNLASDIRKNDILFIDISQKEGNNGIFLYRDVFYTNMYIRKIAWSLSENLKVIPANPKLKTEIIEKNLNEFTIDIVGKIVWNASNWN